MQLSFSKGSFPTMPAKVGDAVRVGAPDAMIWRGLLQQPVEGGIKIHCPSSFPPTNTWKISHAALSDRRVLLASEVRKDPVSVVIGT